MGEEIGCWFYFLAEGSRCGGSEGECPVCGFNTVVLEDAMSVLSAKIA